MKAWLLLTIIGALAHSASANVGGYMGSCYNGEGFTTSRACAESSGRAIGHTSNGNAVAVSATASAVYLESGGKTTQASLQLRIEDYSNYYNPESDLPVVVRVVICGFHRSCTYQVRSQATLFARVPGQRIFEGRIVEFTMTNNFGAEYAEELDKVEVLLPGVADVLTIDL